MSSQILNPFCVGLDVHKDNVWASICMSIPGRSKLQFKTKKFRSNHTDLNLMCDWIESFRPFFFQSGYSPDDPSLQTIPVFMESTGKYSTPVFNVLEDRGFDANIVNPRHVRMINGKKTDQRDCAWIAQLGSAGLLFSSYIPEKAIREARNISRTRTKLVQRRGDDLRRIQNILVSANIRMDLIFSDVYGESARNVLRLLLKKDNPSLADVQANISRLCRIMRFRDNAERKEKEEELLKAFSGAKFSPSQKFDLNHTLSRVSEDSRSIIQYQTQLQHILSDYDVQLSLLKDIPGVSDLSAMMILAEVGADMNKFADSSHFISWCGLCPASNQSNNKHKSVKIGKGGTYLKPVLTQCALNAIKTNPYYKAKFARIAKRRGKKRALIAICRKMMIAAYHMLKTGSVFDPSDYEEVTVRQEQKAEHETNEVKETRKKVLGKRIKNSLKEMIANHHEPLEQDMAKLLIELLSRNGYQITDNKMALVE